MTERGDVPEALASSDVLDDAEESDPDVVNGDLIAADDADDEIVIADDADDEIVIADDLADDVPADLTDDAIDEMDRTTVGVPPTRSDN